MVGANWRIRNVIKEGSVSVHQEGGFIHTGILFSGGVFYILNSLNIKPSNCFAVKGIMTAVITIWLFIVLRGKKIND